jgi:hypothetical protein
MRSEAEIRTHLYELAELKDRGERLGFGAGEISGAMAAMIWILGEHGSQNYNRAVEMIHERARHLKAAGNN